MALRLQVISRHRQALGERGWKDFSHAGGTIGRSLESDWVLPDGQRYLSSRHASIDYRSGSYYVVDSSTNGVYVNDAEQPVGRGNPQRLFSGDRIRIGEYEMSVEIEEESDTNDQLSNADHVDPVSKAQRVPPPDPTRADLVPAHEITAVGIEMLISDEAEMESLQIVSRTNAANLRLEPDPPPAKHQRGAAAPPSPAPTLAPKRAEPPPVSAAVRVATSPPSKPAAKAPVAPPPATKAPSISPAPPSAAPRTAAAAAAPSGALDAFFRGAGLPAQKIDDKQADQILHRLGQLMREVVLGVSENLHVRSEHKNVLRVPTTTIQPQNNNPLKFSASVEEALTNLLFRQSSEYLSAVDAIRETFGDIKQHQQNLLAALRTSISDYVGRLDPDELETKFTSGKRGGLMQATNKMKYWDLYKDLYQVVTQHQPGAFPQQFLEEFARAYEHEASRSAPPSAALRNPKVAG
jgi:type VI secretion system protein